MPSSSPNFVWHFSDPRLSSQISRTRTGDSLMSSGTWGQFEWWESHWFCYLPHLDIPKHFIIVPTTYPAVKSCEHAQNKLKPLQKNQSKAQKIMSRNATTSKFPNKIASNAQFPWGSKHSNIPQFVPSLCHSTWQHLPAPRALRLHLEDYLRKVGMVPQKLVVVFQSKYIMGLNMMKPSNIYQTMENMETYHQNMENIRGYDWYNLI